MQWSEDDHCSQDYFELGVNPGLEVLLAMRPPVPAVSSPYIANV